ncbi:MAG: metallophosphoesterase [Armatimonas sp.]
MNTPIKAVVTGDNHLGTYYARLRPDRLHERREALQAGFAHAVSVALEEKAQLFLIAGDLFDRPDPRNSDRAFVARQLRRLHEGGIICVAICGNHDSPRLPGYDGGMVPLHEMAELNGLHLLRRDDDWDSITVQLTIGGESVSVRVRGQSHSFSKTANECPLEGSSSLDAERTAPIEIALLHYGVEGWQIPLAAEPILLKSNLNRLSADLIAVGHLHARNFTYLDSGALLLNPGATERMDWGEERLPTGCALVSLQPGAKAQLEWHEFAAQPMITLEISGEALQAACADSSLTGSATAAIDYVQTAITEAITSAGADVALCLMLRVRLRGTIDESLFHQLDTDAARRFGAARCFHIEMQTDELIVRYDNSELPAGSGGVDIETEIETVVAMLLQQALPGESATDSERAAAAYKTRVLNSAREALLGAYQSIAPGGAGSTI